MLRRIGDRRINEPGQRFDTAFALREVLKKFDARAVAEGLRQLGELSKQLAFGMTSKDVPR